jgi:hypothetical protein
MGTYCWLSGHPGPGLMGRHETRQIWHGTKKCGSCQHKGRSRPCLAFHPGPLGQARHNPNCVARRGTMAGPCGPLGHDPGSPSAPLPRLHIKIPNPPSHRHARCASTPVTTAALSSVAPSSSSPSLSCRADPPPPIFLLIGHRHLHRPGGHKRGHGVIA